MWTIKGAMGSTSDSVAEAQKYRASTEGGREFFRPLLKKYSLNWDTVNPLRIWSLKLWEVSYYFVQDLNIHRPWFWFLLLYAVLLHLMNISTLHLINLFFLVNCVIFQHGFHHGISGPCVPSCAFYFCVFFLIKGGCWEHILSSFCFLMCSFLKLHSLHGSLFCSHSLLWLQSIVSSFICLPWPEEFPGF